MGSAENVASDRNGLGPSPLLSGQAVVWGETPALRIAALEAKVASLLQDRVEPSRGVTHEAFAALAARVSELEAAAKDTEEHLVCRLSEMAIRLGQVEGRVTSLSEMTVRLGQVGFSGVGGGSVTEEVRDDAPLERRIAELLSNKYGGMICSYRKIAVDIIAMVRAP